MGIMEERKEHVVKDPWTRTMVGGDRMWKRAGRQSRGEQWGKNEDNPN